jgi:hypothetical protein
LFRLRGFAGEATTATAGTAAPLLAQCQEAPVQDSVVNGSLLPHPHGRTMEVMTTVLPLRPWLAIQLIAVLMSCKTSSGAEPEKPRVQAYKDAAFTEFFRRTNGCVAGDGAMSVPLSDGRVLWLFGDSFVDTFDAVTGTVPCLFQVRNTAMVHHKTDLRNARTLVDTNPASRTFFRYAGGDSFWYWPVNGFQEGNTVYVYLTKLKPGGGLGFETVGHAWARMRFPEMNVDEYEPLPDFKGIDFGCGFVKDTDGVYTYAFGSKLVKLDSFVYVARFKTADPGRDWSYWDGSSWTEDVTKAAVIGRGAAPSLHVCKVKSKYVLTSSELSVRCDQGKEIYMSTSERPTGPFSRRKTVFTVDDTVQGHHPFFYLPVAHPEFLDEKRGLLVTYSINGYEPCLKNCVKGRMNPDYYRPKAIRVPLELIGIEQPRNAGQ